MRWGCVHIFPFSFVNLFRVYVHGYLFPEEWMKDVLKCGYTAMFMHGISKALG